MAGIPPGDLALQEPAEGAQVVGAVLSPTGSITPVSTPTTPSALSPEGMYCYGNERQALADQTRFFNNELLSDVVLKVMKSYIYRKLGNIHRQSPVLKILK